MLSKHMLSRLLLSTRFTTSAPEERVLRPGTILRQPRIFSNADVVDYAKVSHDSNPLHLDPESARNAGFQDCLVHGMLVASLFPRIIAAQFVSFVIPQFFIILDLVFYISSSESTMLFNTLLQIVTEKSLE